MDGLYLFEGFFLITKVKNFKNKILLNEANQLIQLQEEGSEEVFDNPLTQVELQKEQLIQLLDKHGYPTIQSQLRPSLFLHIRRFTLLSTTLI